MNWEVIITGTCNVAVEGAADEESACELAVDQICLGSFNTYQAYARVKSGREWEQAKIRADVMVLK